MLLEEVFVCLLPPQCPESLLIQQHRRAAGASKGPTHRDGPAQTCHREWHLMDTMALLPPCKHQHSSFPAGSWPAICWPCLPSPLGTKCSSGWAWSDLGREFWVLSVPFLSTLPESSPISPRAVLVAPQAPVTRLTPWSTQPPLYSSAPLISSLHHG